MSLDQREPAPTIPRPTVGSVASSTASPRLTVLLVEDDPDMRGLMALVLERGGCEVLEAGDGRAAMGVLQRHPRPDIVVTDLMMPVMSGMDLIRQLRSESRTADLPILAVSANVHLEEGQQVSGMANQMLDKMSVVQSLMTTVRSTCRAVGQGISQSTSAGSLSSLET